MAIQIIIKKGIDDPYGTSKRSEEGRRVIRSPNYVQGWWENITSEPIYIEDKAHLKRVCQQHGVIPKMFIKPKSQGKGYEWSY